MALSLFILGVSSNLTAVFGILIALCAVGISFYLAQKIPHSTVKKLASFYLFLLPLFMIFLFYFLHKSGYFPTISSRWNQFSLVFHAFSDSPLKLLTGFGFGHYTEIFFKHLTDLPLSFYSQEKWNPSWDGVDRTDFHAHHEALQVLFSTGIPGALLYLLMPPCLLWITSRRHFFPCLFILSCFIILSSSWFQMPLTLPFSAALMSVFLRPVPFKIKYPRLYFARSFSLIAGALLLFSSIIQLKTALDFSENTSWFAQKMNPSPLLEKSTIDGLYDAGGYHLAFHTQSFVEDAKESDYDLYPDEKDQLMQLIQQNNRIHNKSLYGLTSHLSLMDCFFKCLVQDLVKDTKNTGDKNEKLFSEWENLVAIAQYTMPKRTDLLVPYFRFLLGHQKVESLDTLCHHILSNNPDDAIGLWFKGASLIQQGDNQGYSLMQKAMTLGAGHFIPIPAALEEKVFYFNLNKDDPLIF